MAETTNRVHTCSTGEVLQDGFGKALLLLHHKLTLYLSLHCSKVPGVVVSRDQDVVVQRPAMAAPRSLATAATLAAGRTQQIPTNVCAG